MNPDRVVATTTALTRTRENPITLDPVVASHHGLAGVSLAAGHGSLVEAPPQVFRGYVERGCHSARLA